MRGILIDPFEKTVREVEVEPGIKSIYSLIGQDCFSAVQVSPDVLYVDDEGLFREGQRYFKLSSYPQPLGGKSLLLGVDETGESTSAVHSVSEIKSMLEWVRPDLRYSHSRESSGTMDHPVFGRVSYIRRDAVFVDKDGNEFTR